GFSAVVFGDSDFMTNQGIIHGLNRDLALNSFLFLADEKDIISIRPKQLKGTKVELTTSAQRGVILGGIALPLSLFVLSSIIWFRRRGS
ncbi:MAG: gliding motility ABC transporter, partial [Bdellovibrionales bacterium]|nr:gliding motility ABC transporter [Bdellovibrionales bacterium]